MKIIRCVFLILSFNLLLVTSVSADEIGDYEEKVYSSLESISISDLTPENMSDISVQDVFSYIFSIVKAAFIKPVKILGTVLVCAIVEHLILTLSNGKAYYSTVISFTSVAGISSMVISSVEDIASALESVQAFLIGYVPIYGSIVATSGNLSAATSYCAILLYVSESVTAVMSTVLKPLIACMMALSVVRSVNGNMPNILRALSKLSTTLIGFVLTVFLGVIGLQGVTGKYSGKVAIKAGRYLVSSFVPVIGNAITESYQTVVSSLDMLRSVVGCFGVVVICMVMLVPIVNAFLYKMTFSVAQFLAIALSADNLGKLCKDFSDIYSMLLYAVIIYMMLLVISTGALIALGRMNL